MLEPREADIPALFLVLVVLPLAIYILLGKWSETTKKKERISLLAQLAAEESLREEAMATATLIPIVSSSLPDNVHGHSHSHSHECARCFAPATTRCSKCKSVRYCSGKCQIIHWRQGHKLECEQLEYTSATSSPNSSISGLEKAPASDTIYPQASTAQVSTPEKRSSRKSNREMLRGVEAMFDSPEETSRSRRSSSSSSKEAYTRHKSRNNESFISEEETGEVHDTKATTPSRRSFGVSSSAKNGPNACEIKMDSTSDKGNLQRQATTSTEETTESNNRAKSRSSSNPTGAKLSKSSKLSKSMKASGEQPCSDESRVNRVKDSTATHAEGSNGAASVGIMKMMGLRKSTKLPRHNGSEAISDTDLKIMLFPYDEFVKFSQCEVFNLLPRGLLNCGNSCYANAVLQCLTSTKPLTIYLLRRSHSRDCCGKDWCLMCELEQHVMMLKESGGPLSPSRILSHMRSINGHIGDGSQEDAHEFLRLLVTSMQSICLERLGGENAVDPRLQETTFIQHTFGGRLRSKVKCLRCHHESERYENFMDLTLEIFGWVESLEDALTQFTTTEDLDGENMYRCGRCASYVRARKQLSIHEAPNILTIVLKRFQEGRYGKINKCITFPDMLDMIPFMMGKDDIPPLYMLYAVVVHLDTLNASFSGHYVSYVKDLQGTWFRIDDTEVQPVPMSQVMSEGAYILFYMRSCPRPPRAISQKPARRPAPPPTRHTTSKTHNPSRAGQHKPGSHFVGPGPSTDLRPNICTTIPKPMSTGILRSTTRNVLPMTETYADSISMEFPDPASSDWSIFTSSDDASFTTESTRDSFSTVDYADTCNIDPISSIFSNLYGPERSTQRMVSCRSFSGSKAQTQFVSEMKGYVSELYSSDVSYESSGRDGIVRTCEL